MSVLLLTLGVAGVAGVGAYVTVRRWRSLAVAVVVIGAAVLTVLLVMVLTDTGLARWDVSAATWASEHATDTSTRVLRAVTGLGVSAVVWALAAAVALASFRWLRARPGVAAVFLVAVIAGQAAIVSTLKWAVGRDRPDIDPLTSFGGAAFPSGHAGTAAAGFAAFALLLGLGRSTRTQAVLAGAAAAVAVAVAASRVLLGVHWLTDAVAGVAVGWGWFALCALALLGAERGVPTARPEWDLRPPDR